MVAGGVAEYQYTHPEDLSKEEIKTLILNAKTKMETSAWSYYLVDWHYEEETSVADYHTKVVHNADNSYVVTLSGSSDEVHSIKNGVYKWLNNSWTEYTNNQSTPTTYGEKLDTFLLHNLIDFDKMLLDENNLFAGNSYNGYYLYWHRNPLEGGMQKIELLSNCHIDRIVDSNLYGYTITFYEDTNFGGYIR